ncbi:MAG: restriction endonuclease [Rudaea sp.]
MNDPDSKREITTNIANDVGATFGPIIANHRDPERTTRYHIDAACEQLGDRRVLSSSDFDILVQKIVFYLQFWAGRIAVKQRSAGRPVTSIKALFQKKVARWHEAKVLRPALLYEPTRVVWAALKRQTNLVWPTKSGVNYDEQGYPIGFERLPALDPPQAESPEYDPELTFLDHLLPSRKESKQRAANRRFAHVMESYEKEQSRREVLNCEKAEAFQRELTAYVEAKSAHDANVVRAMDKVERFQHSWHDGGEEGVLTAAELLLHSSVYPDWYPYQFDLSYLRESKTLVVNAKLPLPFALPMTEPIASDESRNTIKEKKLSESAARRRYDDICYQIVLRTFHELFQADEPDALSIVVFNGWVEAPNPATGRIEKSCVLSVQAHKAEFLTFDLLKVDPKSCFLSLKGVAAPALMDLVPVRPLIQLNMSDSRFVDGRLVGDTINDSLNLAAMDWEDFEHLVRELFAKIFSGPGSEVKVTRASRDGGVDAIALDPDPIKGGKIVIQAKRYTNTVDVSAVRDLYGTVLNEGANRGILVTTSNYGPDAYKFALNKPITLINGSNLLAMLSEHGQKARIDLQEAKQIARASQMD